MSLLAAEGSAIVNVLLLITRELREQSRKVSTYWLRLSAAAGLMGVAGLSQLSSREVGGEELFEAMHVVLVLSVFFIVPLMAADCISKERRTGTLGLLFLTPLKIRDVVFAKAATVFIGATKAVVATFPVLAVPILMGGVSWEHVSVSVLIISTTLVWMLAVGVFASSNCRTLRGVACTILLFALFGGFLLSFKTGWTVAPVSMRGDFDRWDSLTERGLRACVEVDYFASRIGRNGNATWVVLNHLMWVGGGSVVLLLAAALNLRRRWREEPPSAARLKLQKDFTKPRYAAGFLTRYLKAKLSRNPIGWLQQRTWQARMLAWVWISVLGTVYGWLLFSLPTSLWFITGFQVMFSIGLIACLWIVSAVSFSQERECGALELILVTPLSSRQLLRNRLFGIMEQFGLVVLAMSVMWVIYFSAGGRGGYEWRFNLVLWGVVLFGYSCIPTIGLYCSMRSKNAFVSIVETFLVAIAGPIVFLVIGDFVGNNGFVKDVLQRMTGLGWRVIEVSVKYGFPVVYLVGGTLFLRRRLIQLVEKRQFLEER